MEGVEEELEPGDSGDEDFLEPRTGNEFGEASDWVDPFDLKESENTRSNRSLSLMKSGNRTLLAGNLLGYASGATGIAAIAANQPELGYALLAGSGTGITSGLGGFVVQYTRASIEDFGTLVDGLEGNHWIYSQEDLAPLLENSHSLKEYESTEAAIDDYESWKKKIDEEGTVGNSHDLNAIRWEETDAGDYVYKLVLAEAIDMREEGLTKEGNVKIEPYQAFVGRVSKEEFAEHVNPLDPSVEDSKYLSRIQGYRPEGNKTDNLIGRAIRNVKNRIGDGAENVEVSNYQTIDESQERTQKEKETE